MLTSKLRLTVVGESPGDIAALLQPLGLKPLTAPALPALTTHANDLPEVLVMDLRKQRRVPPDVGELTRRHPALGVVIVAASLDPEMMLDALHAGAKGFVAAPLSSGELQNAIQRVVVPRAAPVSELLAFIGAKGGVGTTTLAINIATALARHTKGDALIVDLHGRYGDVTACLGVEPRFSVADALENTHRLDDAYMRGLVVSTDADLDVLAAADRGAIDVARLRALLAFAKKQYQYTVVDVPRTEPAVLDALESATRIVVVVSQEVTAVRSAARLLSVLRQRYPAERIEIALGRQDRDAEIQTDDLVSTLGGAVRVFPNDYRQALECLNRGRPLILENHSRLAAEMSRFVREMTGTPAASREKPARTSILPKWLGGGHA
jgi:pilus assembly protein CpaE